MRVEVGPFYLEDLDWSISDAEGNLLLSGTAWDAISGIGGVQFRKAESVNPVTLREYDYFLIAEDGITEGCEFTLTHEGKGYELQVILD